LGGFLLMALLASGLSRRLIDFIVLPAVVVAQNSGFLGFMVA